MTFSEAIEALKQGKKVKRNCWYESLYLQELIDGKHIKTTEGGKASFERTESYWANKDDILAEDWMVVE